jgi:hypothetical protein
MRLSPTPWKRQASDLSTLACEFQRISRSLMFGEYPNLQRHAPGDVDHSCCDESPHAEALDPLMRPFHRLSQVEFAKFVRKKSPRENTILGEASLGALP